MKVGQRIRNIHTKDEYTVIEILQSENARRLHIFEVASDDMKLMRFNSIYEKHYEVIDNKTTGEEE